MSVPRRLYSFLYYWCFRERVWCKKRDLGIELAEGRLSLRDGESGTEKLDRLVIGEDFWADQNPD